MSGRIGSRCSGRNGNWPEDIAPLVAAYEGSLRTLKVIDRTDPITEIVAKKIIEIAQIGIRDPARLGQLALQEIGISGSG